MIEKLLAAEEGLWSVELFVSNSAISVEYSGDLGLQKFLVVVHTHLFILVVGLGVAS